MKEYTMQDLENLSVEELKAAIEWAKEQQEDYKS